MNQILSKQLNLWKLGFMISSYDKKTEGKNMQILMICPRCLNSGVFETEYHKALVSYEMQIVKFVRLVQRIQRNLKLPSCSCILRFSQLVPTNTNYKKSHLRRHCNLKFTALRTSNFTYHKSGLNIKHLSLFSILREEWKSHITSWLVLPK
jgi:hypothetical protein